MKRYSIGILATVLVIVFCLAGGVSAQIKAETFTLSPMIGGYLFEGNQDLEDKPVYGVGVGYSFDDRWGTEAVFNYIDTESDTGGTDVSAYLYRLDGLYHFNGGGRLVPYVAAGIGGITFDPDRGDSDNDALVNYGAGLKYFVTDSIALRGDVRHVISFDSTHHNLLYTLGVTFLFGGAEETVAVARRDSDGDGVYDDMDKCPGTPTGVKVDSSGCPLDSDGDGVYDYLDRCPDTPSGVKVDSSGCPLDSDGDGVYDYLDECPGTPTGARVDERGCWVLKGVQFDIGKSTIQRESYPILDAVVEVMKKNPLLSIEIQGHTDNTGSAEFNQQLSRNRANAVMEYVASKGIDRYRLSAKGFGMVKPIAPNTTAEGRAKNRRVELKPVQ